MSGAVALAQKPASVVRGYTEKVRDHASAMQRAQDQYFAALKRAESEYFARVQRITEVVMQETAAAVADGNGSAENAENVA